MARKKKQLAAVESAPQAPQTVEISADLQQKLTTLKVLATTHNLLSKGFFQVGNHSLVENSMAFIQSLHQQLLDEAVKHPQAGLVAELQPFLTKPEVK